MNLSKYMPKIRKGSRVIHRDLSFFFSGLVVIYAISGLVLNHKKDFNSDYVIKQHHITVSGSFPMAEAQIDKDIVLQWLQPLDEAKNYTRYYFPSEGQIKVFIKGGSSLVVDMQTGTALYESFKKRHVISAFNRLHYNPNRWWTAFSDIFVISLLVITLSGCILVKGPKGLWGRGGILLLAGILVPLAFILW